MTNKIFKNKYLKYWGILLFISFWWLIKILFFSSNLYLPNPLQTFLRISELFLTIEIFQDILETLKRFILGFSFALILGIPIGFALGYFQKGYATFEIILDFFRSIPVTALFPLFILFYGVSESTITAMAAFACFFVILLNSAYGVLYVNKTYLQVIKTLGANEFQAIKEVVFYEALPFLFVGLRVAVSLGLIVVVVSEMFIGRRYGLGARIYKAHETYLIVDVYSLIIIVGLIGYFLNKILILLERKFIHWKTSYSFDS